MSKILIIAEKPSVATDLSKALAGELGKFEKVGKSRDSQHFSSEKALITSAVGHLVELKMPTGPNGKNLPWNFKVLPAIPDQFELQPTEETEKRCKHVISLIRNKEVDMIVNACDAGREGELIFQYIMDLAAVKKPVRRLWMQSMTSASIREAWQTMRSDEEMKPLADAARCRSEADWLVGLNATRALTSYRSRHGGFNITPVGRVQTPTLAILAKREREIEAFRSEDYFEVHADFAIPNGEYPGIWSDPNWKKNPERPHDRAERLWTRDQAEQIQARCAGRRGQVSEETKPQRQIAPLLYDLTTLQREAPFTAVQTLQIAQALYERHKMITYPRTDARYLPEDYIERVKEVHGELASHSGLSVAPWAAASLEEGRITMQKRIFNNAKISDHFAIIPTGRVGALRDAEAKLYDMIVKRFVAVFYPAAEYQITTRWTRIEQDGLTDAFKSSGRVLVEPGWLAVYGRQAGVASGKGDLISLGGEESAAVESVRVDDKQTQPPARFNESTLLAAMEGAGKLIDDEELREAMAERGLGTPATRAATIEGLLRQKYIARDGRELNVTGKGMRLIHLLEQMEIKALRSPSMTGEWEAKLNRMEAGELDREVFMTEIKDYARAIVGKAKKHYDEAVNRVFPDLDCPCPNCEATRLRQTDATYECYNPDCTFKISKYIAGHHLTEAEAVALFSEKALPEMEGFMSRFNKPFSAGLKLTQPVSKTGKKGKWKTEFVFENSEELRPEDLREDQKIASLKLTNGLDVSLYETDRTYMIPEFKTKQSPEGVQIGKTILKRELRAEDIKALLTQGRTPLLDGFVSKRTRRPFKAHLTLDAETGKIGFEFAPREPKKTSKKA